MLSPETIRSEDKPNILYLVHRVPCPPNRGDRIRSYHLLRHLSEKYNVYLATLADEEVTEAVDTELSELCTETAIVDVDRIKRWGRAAWNVTCGRTATEGLFRSPQLKNIVSDWGKQHQFDAVVVFCSSMAQYLDCLDIKDIPVIVDLVDVDSQKWFDYAEKRPSWKKWLYKMEGRRLRRLEQEITHAVSAVTLVSEAEATLFRTTCPNEKTHSVINGVDTEYFHPNFKSERTDNPLCVFVGAMDYEPNIDAVVWFAQHVWPLVRAKLPNAQFQIVGRNPTKEVTRLNETAGVEVIGGVPDVRDYVASATIAVAPLRIARGIQNKVLEAMAMGKPVIASAEALEGLAVTPGQNVIEAKTAENWSEEILRVFEDKELQQEFGDKGRNYAENHHSWDSCLQPFGNLCLSSD
ncbi:MAG: sugar transferase [Blastopirellula sp.]|nr:MAG: sugar transferase [Blastopirellula sp.]